MDEFAFKTLISASIGKKGHIFRKRKKWLEEKEINELDRTTKRVLRCYNIVTYTPLTHGLNARLHTFQLERNRRMD